MSKHATPTPTLSPDAQAICAELLEIRKVLVLMAEDQLGYRVRIGGHDPDAWPPVLTTWAAVEGQDETVQL